MFTKEWQETDKGYPYFLGSLGFVESQGKMVDL